VTPGHIQKEGGVGGVGGGGWGVGGWGGGVVGGGGVWGWGVGERSVLPRGFAGGYIWGHVRVAASKG
jgi:hypothetical protein